jgi:hypothetical protein
MLKNYLVCFVLWILLQLLVEINCSIERHTATTTLINDKLYILGEDGNDFFYFDVSVPLNTENLLRNNLTTIVPPHSGATSVKGGANNNTLFFYGGYNYAKMELVYTFDTKSNSWSIPKITGDNVIRKFRLTEIIDNNGKMYLWSGSDMKGGFANNMLILDTINLSWGNGSLIGAPSPRSDYSAVLLPNDKIIYMGKVVMLILFIILSLISNFFFNILFRWF